MTALIHMSPQHDLENLVDLSGTLAEDRSMRLQMGREGKRLVVTMITKLSSRSIMIRYEVIRPHTNKSNNGPTAAPTTTTTTTTHHRTSVYP